MALFAAIDRYWDVCTQTRVCVCVYIHVYLFARVACVRPIMNFTFLHTVWHAIIAAAASAATAAVVADMTTRTRYYVHRHYRVVFAIDGTDWKEYCIFDRVFALCPTIIRFFHSHSSLFRMCVYHNARRVIHKIHNAMHYCRHAKRMFN